jgi:mannose-1-phosphate guanylyltransferase/mannose-6-phosphate isomerase
VLTNADFRFIASEQFSAVGLDPSAILIEPQGRNTAPVALWLEKTDLDGLMLIAPSDHVVPDAPAFRAALAAGVLAAQDGLVVTFCIKPTHAETG